MNPVQHVHRVASNLIQMVGDLPGRTAINVVFNASCSSATSSVIMIAAVPANDPDYPDLIIGYGLHEAAHIRFTTFSQDWRKWGDYCFGLINGLEDVRVERAVCLVYPGASPILSTLVRFCVRNGMFPKVTELLADNRPGAALQMFVLYTGRALLQQPYMAEYAREAVPEIDRLVGVDVRKQIERLVAKILKADCTKDAAVLGHEIYRLIHQFESQDQSHCAGDITEVGIGELIAAVMTARSERAVRQGKTLHICGGSNHLRERRAPELFYDGPTMTLSALAAVIRRKIRDERESSLEVARSGTRLNVENLARMEWGESRLFRRNHAGRDVSGSVLVLTDCSSSMHAESRNVFSCQCERVIALAVDSVPEISLAMYRFGSDFWRVKGYDETLRSALCLMGPLAQGGTPTNEAVSLSLPKLLAQPGKKKVMILLTDGAAASEDELATTLDQAQKHGVTVLCFGIRIELPSYYPNAQTINSIQSLPVAVGKSFTSAYLGGV